jgi:hypothetical protein
MVRDYGSRVWPLQDRDGSGSVCLSMIVSENRFPRFRIML